MKTLNATSLIPWTHWFFYGATRSGKTELAATFPKPLFIVPQNEASITTLMGRDIPYVLCGSPFGSYDEEKGVGGLIGMRDKNGNQEIGILDSLERLYKKNPKTFPYETIVLESMSHYTDLVEEHLTAGATKQMDPLAWGKMKDHLRHVQTRLRAMQVHVVFTCLDELKTNEKSGVTIGGPLMSGKAARTLPSSCDAIGYCRRAGDRFFVHFKNFGHYQAGSRFTRMPSQIENFSFKAVEQFTLPDDSKRTKVTPIRKTVLK
jgi:hypothetical protein